MNGFEKRASRIKGKIISTTLELLQLSDPQKIRIVDIAKQANISQVTIYNYFGSKEALLDEVFKTYVDHSIMELENYMKEENSLKDKIETIMFQEKKSYAVMPPSLIQKLVIEDREVYRYMEEQYKKRVVPLFIQLIEEGKERGEISSEVSVASVLAFIQMVMKQSNELLEMAKQSGNAEEFLNSIVHIFFYGIGVKS